MTEIGIVIGSTRPGRRGKMVGRWVLDAAAETTDTHLQLLDLADFALPLLDEPLPAAIGDYANSHTIAWAKRVAAMDGFIFVTPEYNHSAPAALKNAIDFLFAEWHDKAAGFVSYGIGGGVRAVEHLRTVLAEVKVADVRTQVALMLGEDFEIASMTEPGIVRPRPRQAELLNRMLGEVIAWSDALALLREARG
jgi:NAD(P)H-dependent FMN reductase